VPGKPTGWLENEGADHHLVEMDPLRGTRPDGALVEYVADPGAAVGATGTPVLVLAPRGRRIAARLVDTVIASVFAFLGFAAVVESTDGAVLVVLMPVGFMAGGLFYCVPMVHWWGATVGKRIFGLRVVRLWSDGTLPPSWRDAFIREFDRGGFLALPVLNILVGAILLVQMFKDRGPYYLSQFDRAARTVVVRWPAIAGVE